MTGACSQPGIVETRTKVLLPNDSGSTSMNMIPCTVPGVRATMPTHTEIQQKHRANAIDSPSAATSDSGSVAIRKPMRYPKLRRMTHNSR